MHSFGHFHYPPPPQKTTGCLYDHLRWADVFVVVYSICDKYSLLIAEDYLEELSKMKMPSYYTTLLLANKRDLEHARYVWANFDKWEPNSHEGSVGPVKAICKRDQG